MKHFLLTFLLFLALPLGGHVVCNAQKTALPKTYRYRITLKDKDGTPYSIQHPEKFLSPKSIERRRRMGLAIDHYDLPISPKYLSAIRKTGAHIFNCSKWNNTVQVEVGDSSLIQRIQALPFVADALLVYASPDSVGLVSTIHRKEEIKADTTYTAEYYGKSQGQIGQLHLDALHDKGFRGKNVTIAVIDGGFYNADVIPAFKETRILGTKNFARPDSCVYSEHAHGMMVLSCIAPNAPHRLVGTAPEASFYLLQSEDTWFEYRGEEDNWCAALEYADSVGADIVTSSLGYTYFDTPAAKLEYEWLDGRHELNSRSASLAASRGILLCNSAGNEGDGHWKKIGFPADAHDILTVGAVDAEGQNALFSSLGYSADHRIKPDVMALGFQAALLGTDGTVSSANGTSFSCPIMAGAVACLCQSFPHLRPTAIMQAVREAGHCYGHPNEVFGNGIPDMRKAYDILDGKNAQPAF